MMIYIYTSIPAVMRIITTSIAMLAMALMDFAQHPAVSWTRSFGGHYSDMGVFIHQRANGSFFMAANSSSIDGQIGEGTGPVLLMGLDGAGQYQWGVRIGGPNSDRVMHGAMMADSNYVLIGRIYGPVVPPPGENEPSDIWIIKVSPTGNIIWQRTYGGTGEDFGMFVAAKPDGGCLISGTYGDAMGDDSGWDAWAASLDADGNELWQRTWGGVGFDVGSSIASTSDDGAIVAGTIGATNGDVSLPSGSDWNIRVVKLDAAGSTEWEQTFGGSEPDQPSTILSLADGGYLMLAASFSTNGDVDEGLGTGGVVVFRLNAQGEVMWERRYGGEGAESATDVVQLGEDFVIAATTTSPIYGDISVRYDTDQGDGWLLIIDPDGELLWKNTYGSSGGDWLSALAVTDDGFAVTGGSMSADRFVPGNAGYQDIWTMRFQNRSNLIGGTLYVDADADSALGQNDPPSPRGWCNWTSMMHSP
jgi:hypothetical protein